MIKITNAYIDSDVLAYNAACSVEKASYQWVKKDGSAESEVFNTAREAKDFKELNELMEDDFDNDWERIKGIRLGTVKEAEKNCDSIVKEYCDTAIQLTGNKDLSFTGWLTSSKAPKTKDIKGLENKYQGNRDPSTKPKLLKHCREYLQKTYPWIKMAALGFEADTHIVARCEKEGMKAVGLFIDKDLAQMEGGQFIDMKRPKNLRKIIKTTKLGELWWEANPRGVKSVKGHGFKWLCFQAVVGDAADGYKGLDGVGEVTGFEILADRESKEDCIKSLLEFYENKLRNGTLSKAAKIAGALPEKGTHKYISWEGSRKKLSAKELLNQHLFLAYQERGATDTINVEDFLT